ncbi:MAG: hypothetical protein HZB81_03700 [Deltaproteobacteria bacterium]|nr:hypothetical protein [Deltaproteobacteria bacterium]
MIAELQEGQNIILHNGDGTITITFHSPTVKSNELAIVFLPAVSAIAALAKGKMFPLNDWVFHMPPASDNHKTAQRAFRPDLFLLFIYIYHSPMTFLVTVEKVFLGWQKKEGEKRAIARQWARKGDT